MSKGIAIYAPAGIVNKTSEVFGKDIANLRLFQALARHGGFEEFGVLTNVVQPDDKAVVETLLDGQPSATRIWNDVILKTSALVRAGAILRGMPNLADLAWLREQAGSGAYSLIGLVHTLAPPATRNQISELAVAPVQAWDAMICPSPVVQSGVRQLVAERGAILASRFRGKPPPEPQYPLIPLGVDAEAFAALADRPAVRADIRGKLGMGETDCLVLWVGRLSFFEKAFPQPMFIALEEACRRAGRGIHFAMVGWFPNGEKDRELYDEAARAYAPSVRLHVLNGNDQALVGAMWAASDIFLSLVDNIQETFGLTPLEAMACGKPIVASDWDGYCFTVRHGIDGFLIPTLLAPSGAGGLMNARHVIGIDSYQSYVGTVAQYTAVDIGRAAEALATLVADPDLRRRMGAAGRARARETFAWPVIARQVAALVADLAERRAAAAPKPPAAPSSSGTRGDPFARFADFATATLTPDTIIRIRADQPRAAPASSPIRLDRFAEMWRLNQAACTALVQRLSDGVPRRVGDLLVDYPPDHHDAVCLTLAWLCKMGVLSAGTDLR